MEYFLGQESLFEYPVFVFDVCHLKLIITVLIGYSKQLPYSAPHVSMICVQFWSHSMLEQQSFWFK
jgi:hypothetical protein